jgi:pimeloyl-ACP methyl ester carboxylesterase
VPGLFVPGWGAVPGLYRPGLPDGWEILELPRFGPTGGRLPAYCRWLGAEIDRRVGPVALAGHSTGAALAILAAVERPAAIERLVLLSPCGLPLAKPLLASVGTLVGQVTRGWYPPAELGRAVGGVLVAPRAALRLARTAHDLDLTAELDRLKAFGVPSTVVGCSSDRLTTPAHCRRIAALLGARYRELDGRAGHIWMIADPPLLALALAGDTG